MPDRRKHRGKNSKDNDLFSGKNIPVLCKAVEELSWLLSRAYSLKSSLKLVGDRHRLVSRQRMALERCACSDSSLKARCDKALEPEDFDPGGEIMLDGYNLLITLESALSGAFIFKGRDGAFRDIAGIHGTYKCVEETIPALILIADFLSSLNPSKVIFLLDAPVSNSGRLKELIYRENSIDSDKWDVILDNNPDKILCEAPCAVISSDSLVLDRCRKWLNPFPYILGKRAETIELIDF
jgi:hypothetical protein